MQKRLPMKSTAGLLLHAILSDTLNLESPTTTDADRQMLAILCRYCGVDDCTALATRQFKAKSQELGLLSQEISGMQRKVDAITSKVDAIAGKLEEMVTMRQQPA